VLKILQFCRALLEGMFKRRYRYLKSKQSMSASASSEVRQEKNTDCVVVELRLCFRMVLRRGRVGRNKSVCERGRAYYRNGIGCIEHIMVIILVGIGLSGCGSRLFAQMVDKGSGLCANDRVADGE